MAGANGRYWRRKIHAVAHHGRATDALIRHNNRSKSCDCATEKPERQGARRTVSGSGIKSFTARLQIAFGLRLQKLPATEIAQRTMAALRLCQLEDVADAHPLDLHTAQRRMVAVASLEALKPAILLLDEPSRDFDATGLASKTGWQCVVHVAPAKRSVMTLHLRSAIFRA
jgi:ABC-type Fe3+/spermidine/putrescine transport system ATPase subunit